MNSLETTLLQTAAANQWQQCKVKEHHGIVIPLFSLHSEKSAGIGEYLDLIPLIHWCREVGLDVIQLLPLNDTGLGTSPYSALSAFALSPIYLSLHALEGIEKILNYNDKLNKIRYWNKTSRVKYHIVRELKFILLREYFELFFSEISQSKKYRDFVEQNLWLKPYSIFRAIKEIQLWKEWESWPEEYRNPTAAKINVTYEQNKLLCDFSIFLQFLCYEQMEKVKEVAVQNKILLKGDIPILVSRDSVDVWSHPELFKMEYGAGAPPDVYSKTGQDWGFPLYNWDHLAKIDYSWWKERMRLASHLFHLYRLDHVIGFYRFWAIPLTKTPLDGHNIPSEEGAQKALGEQLMKMLLQAAPILPIGEDLGTVPEWVKESLHGLGICTTKVMRWERYWDRENKPFIDPKQYSPMTMTTVSTHDSDTLTLWWRHHPNDAKVYCEYKGWEYTPFLTAERLKSILYDSHHSNSLFHINPLQEYLALFPELVSGNPNDERINFPGKVLDRNWTYRLHVNVETLSAHMGLHALFKELL